MHALVLPNPRLSVVSRARPSQVENRSDAIRHKYPLSFSLSDQFHGTALTTTESRATICSTYYVLLVVMCDGYGVLVFVPAQSWTVKDETSLTPIRTSPALVLTDKERQGTPRRRLSTVFHPSSIFQNATPKSFLALRSTPTKESLSAT